MDANGIGENGRGSRGSGGWRHGLWNVSGPSYLVASVAMNPPFRIPTFIILAVALPSFAGERLMVDGYASQSGGGILLGLSPVGAAVYSVPSAPSDRSFVPP